MNDSILQWGFISTARINQSLIPPLRMSKRNHLLGIASRNIETAQDYSKKNHIPKMYGSYEDLLADPGIDVVYISLPNSLHAEWTIKALQAGKHVLCEKPLAVSLAEVDAIRAAANQSGRSVAEAFMYRHHPQTIKVQQLIENGSVGKLQFMRGWFTFSLKRPEDIRLKADLGGGSLWDIGCYPVSYARMLMGAKPTQVYGWQIPSSSGVDLTLAGQLLFPGDVCAQVFSSFHSPRSSGFQIVGSEASLSISDPFRPHGKSQIILTGDNQKEQIQTIQQELYLGEVENMADAIINGKPPRLSLQESRDNIETILALLEAARMGSIVKL
jgi:D-xylose 1-dehydrogenase (NADP+, D-xylono-1,5-lactone-forming)